MPTASQKCLNLDVYEVNAKSCNGVLTKKQRPKMQKKLKKRKEEQKAQRAAKKKAENPTGGFVGLEGDDLDGGSDSDDDDEVLSSVVFDPSVRRSLVRLLMEDQSMPQHTCIQRLCDCNFANIPLPCNNSDEAIMKSIVTSAVNRQHIRRTVKTLYPMLMGMF